MMEKELYTKITIDMNGVKTTWEYPDDSPRASELIDAFYGLLVAQTYSPETIKEGMRMFLGGMSGMEEFMEKTCDE